MFSNARRVTRFGLVGCIICAFVSEISGYAVRIENRMNGSAFRDIWARVMFLKFSKLHEPQANAI